MAKNLIACGDVLDYTVPAATTIASGEGVLIGDLLGVAIVGGTENEVIAVQVEGVFELAKNTGAGTDFAQGEKVYWDAATKKITGDDAAGANKHIGYAYKAAVVADTTGQVKLLG